MIKHKKKNAIAPGGKHNIPYHTYQTKESVLIVVSNFLLINNTVLTANK